MLLLDAIVAWFLLLCVDFCCLFTSWCFLWFIVTLLVVLQAVISVGRFGCCGLIVACLILLCVYWLVDLVFGAVVILCFGFAFAFLVDFVGCFGICWRLVVLLRLFGGWVYLVVC